MEAPRFFKAKDAIPEGSHFIDVFEQAVEELFFVQNPSLRGGMPGVAEKLAAFRTSALADTWVYYPGQRTAVRIPEEAAYFTLRTARNRNLITEAEQTAYRDAIVGIAGLSVGSAALSALVATGGPKNIKLADPDTIDVTNLNRINATLADVGRNKTEVAAERSWELDPFLNLELFPEGITHGNFEQFLSTPRLDVFVDEMDAIALKIEARKRCRKLGIPVVMATDNGDSTLLDIERFDLEPERPIFHGRIEIAPQELEHMTRDQFVRLANRIIDPANFTIRQQDSLMQIGRGIAGVPQLYTAASLSGAAVALAVRKIVTGQSMPSGRYTLSLDEATDSVYQSETSKALREANTARFNEHFA